MRLRPAEESSRLRRRARDAAARPRHTSGFRRLLEILQIDVDELAHAAEDGVEALANDVDLLALRRIQRGQRRRPPIADRALEPALQRRRRRFLTTGERRIAGERLLRITKLAF